MASDRPWWHSAVFYQVYPRSFADSDGDGIGDLEGLRRRLPYLTWLGIDALWITPFFPSPQLDFGYDVTDHLGVDPLFGSVSEVERLIREAHELGLRVVIDFIPNHTSDQHPWFAASRSYLGDARRDWYYWADGENGHEPNNWLSLFGGSAWEWDARTRQYYLHSYLREQPDLNWRHPEVREAMADVLRGWLDRGVDGFRIDAFRQLLKDATWPDNPVNPHWSEGMDPYDRLIPIHSTDQDDIVKIISELRAVLDDHPSPTGGGPSSDRVLLAEAYLPIPKLIRYHGSNGDGIQLPSNMNLLQSPWQPGPIAALIEEYEGLLPAGAWPNWVLGNHDRHRIASRLGQDQVRIAAVLLLTLRGTPTLYYGDELGLPDVEVDEERIQDPVGRRTGRPELGRDPARMPMPWTREPGHGFCGGEVEPWLPMRPDSAGFCVAAQREDPDSALSLYRRLLRLRRSEPALAVGTCAMIRDDDRTLCFLREHDSGDAFVALNFTDRRVPLRTPDHRTWDLALTTVPNPAERLLQPHEGRILLARQNGKV